MTLSYTLADLIGTSPLQQVRDAVAAALSIRFPDIAVKSHPGRLDMSDILTKGAFTAPSIHVSVWRLRNGERVSADQDLSMHWRAYIFAEDRQVAGQIFRGDEIGYAIMLGLLDALAEWPFTAWGLENISPAEEAEGEPLVTMKSFERGQCFYVVAWKQTLMRVGEIGDNLGGVWNVCEMPVPETTQTFIPDGVISTAATDTLPGGVDLITIAESDGP